MSFYNRFGCCPPPVCFPAVACYPRRPYLRGFPLLELPWGCRCGRLGCGGGCFGEFRGVCRCGRRGCGGGCFGEFRGCGCGRRGCGGGCGFGVGIGAGFDGGLCGDGVGFGGCGDGVGFGLAGDGCGGGCLPGCRCASCCPGYNPCPGGWANFRSGSGCQAALLSAFLGGRTYTIAPNTVRIVIASDRGVFSSSANPPIPDNQTLLHWLRDVLVEAVNQGFSTFGTFQIVGGYILPARIDGVCVTHVSPTV